MVAMKSKILENRMLLLIGSFFMLTHAQGQNPFREKRGENPGKIIDSIIQSQVELDKIPGAVIQVKKGERMIYKNAFGFAEKYDFNHQLVSPPDKMTMKTLFDIASLTKVIGTTTAIMLLVDRGVLGIEDPVGKYIKAFDSGEKKVITIRNLLTHTAGLYEWYPLYYRCSNKQQTFQLIGELPLKYPVGTGRHYSDLGFVVLGEIIEFVSGIFTSAIPERKYFRFHWV